MVLFLHSYSEYHSISIQNQCLAICDNQAYVNRLNWLLKEDSHYNSLHKGTENEAPQISIQLIYDTFSTQYILGHQESNTSQSNFTIEAKQNIIADKRGTTNAKLPINTHITSSFFEVYVNDQYTYHKIDRSLRAQSHEEVARKFLISKYK